MSSTKIYTKIMDNSKLLILALKFGFVVGCVYYIMIPWYLVVHFFSSSGRKEIFTETKCRRSEPCDQQIIRL